MKSPPILVAAAIVLICAGCSSSPGRPRSDPEATTPSQINEFSVLYSQNCAGCHGINGKGGVAIALVNPVFLAIADDTVVRRTVANGVPGTAMSAFAQASGGMLTEKQIEALVRGIRSWARSEAFVGTTLPPYAAQAPGNSQRGAEGFRTYCSSCHGSTGRGGSKASSVVDSSYLALVSDQYLRTIVIAGRPELGAPDWRGDVEGRAMSDQEISDVVAWLSSQRPQFTGRVTAVSSLDRSSGGLR